MAEKREIKNKQKSQIAEARKITRAKMTTFTVFDFNKVIGDFPYACSKRSHIMLDERKVNVNFRLHCRKVVN